MIRHVEERWPSTETNCSEQQLLSAGLISGDKWPDLIGAATLAARNRRRTRERAFRRARADCGSEKADRRRKPKHLARSSDRRLVA